MAGWTKILVNVTKSREKGEHEIYVQKHVVIIQTFSLS